MDTIIIEVNKHSNEWTKLTTFIEELGLNIIEKKNEQSKILNKRQLGILDGKAKIVFKDDFEMTTEELLGVQ